MVEITTTERGSRSEIGSTLEDIAEQLQSDGPVAIETDGRRLELAPAEPVALKLEGEVEREAAGTEGSIELELEWQEGTESR